MPNNPAMQFPMDAQAFEDAINKVVKALDKLSRGATSTFGSSQSQMGGSLGGTAKLGMWIAAFTVAFQKISDMGAKMFNALAQHIPEVSTTFKMAGDIMMRNLMWPLRQLLMPYLQKILDWVRDNRPMFVKFGQVLANAFRVVIVMAKQFWELLKIIGETFNRSIGGVFDNFSEKIERAMNILVFKIASVAIFLGEALKPVAEFFGKVLAYLYEIGKAFGGEFLKGFVDLFKFDEQLQDFVKLWERLGDALSDLGLDFPVIIGAFKDFGRILGGVVAANMRVWIDLAYDLLVPFINMIELLAEIKKWYDGEGFDWKKINLIKGMKVPGMEGMQDLYKQTAKLGEEDTEKGGSFLAKAIRERDIAKKQRQAERQSNVRIEQNATVVVTEGNAEQAGRNFSKGTGDQVRTELLDELAMEAGGVP